MDNASSIVIEEQVVGGLSQTGIQAKSIEDLEKNNYFDYLNSLAPEPLMLEFIAMQGERYIAVTVKLTDTETEEVSNQVHYLFIVDGQCYDLWLDTDLVSDEQKDAIKEIIP